MLTHITLVIAHSHPHFLFILHNIIRNYPGVRVVGRACTFNHLLQMTTSLKPDIIITDITLPGMKKLSALQQLAANGNQPKIILSWRYHHQPVINEAFAAGYAGFIIYDADPYQYLVAIKQAIKGVVFYCNQSERLIRGNKNLPFAPNAEGLNKTHFNIMYCMWLGYNNKETGIALNLSKTTIDTYKKAIRKAIGSLSSVAIYSFMKKHGIELDR